MHGWNEWFGGHIMGMGLFWILLLVALVVLVVWLARANRGRSAGRTASAEDILEERYARGEIDAEEYRERLADLRRE